MPIRVLSEGNDGNVTQSNTAASMGTATNTAGTTQSTRKRPRIAVWVRRPGARGEDAGTGVDVVRV